MTMTANTWSDVDHSMLKVNHVLQFSAHSVPTPNNALLAVDVVSPSQIQATNFLKYFYVNLKDKAHILNFYKNMAAQSIAYNIFLTLKKDTTTYLGVQPYSVRTDTQSTSLTALCTKFCQIDNIQAS